MDFIIKTFYSSIGEKIKILAIITFIIEAIGSIITGLALSFEMHEALYLLICITGPIVAWVSSWILYAFGELVEKTCDNENNTRRILKTLNEKNSNKTEEDNGEENTTITIEPNESKSNVCENNTHIFQARESVPATKTNYAEGEYVPGKTYSNGEEIIFEGKKYICVVPNGTVWSPAQFPSQWKEISSTEIKE